MNAGQGIETTVRYALVVGCLGGFLAGCDSGGSNGGTGGTGGTTSGSGGSMVPSTVTGGSGGAPTGSGGSGGGFGFGGMGGSVSTGGTGGSVPIGGTGGSVSTGGTGGAAMTPGGTCAANGLISDLEDGMPWINSPCAQGAWWLSADATGTLMPPPSTTAAPFTPATGDRPGSTKAAHFTGRGQTSYAVLTASLNGMATGNGAYDASAWGGIKFWAKGSGTIRVSVPDKSTDPNGGVCSSMAGPMQCFNNFGLDVTLSATWKEVVIPFAMMTQQAGWGLQVPAGIDKTKIYSVNFAVIIPYVGAMAQPAAPYDVWIDDLAFSK